MHYTEINKASWDERTKIHIDSEFYNVPEFLKGKTSLNKIELDLLPDLKGKKLLHLQCHFGQDTISLARMGAEATGIDLSTQAIKTAKELNEQCGTHCEFVESSVYDLPKNLEGQFDVVFTSYGTVGWMPDMDQWADVVSHFLKPGGKFYFIEFHPFCWMHDDNIEEVIYSYFNVEDIKETDEGSYTENDNSTELKSVTWNHPISEIVNALIKSGLSIQKLNEYPSSPYKIFKGMRELSDGTYDIAHSPEQIPLVYAIVAEKL
ncbi:MAG: class I SAM-dependent methyltransferase [Flavobacteriales bacterium]|nr:class I SAM-dependent methyltransferase [Flavobacteriales bacterium]